LQSITEANKMFCLKHKIDHIYIRGKRSKKQIGPGNNIFYFLKTHSDGGKE